MPRQLPAHPTIFQRVGMSLASMGAKMVWGRASSTGGGYGGWGGLTGILCGNWPNAGQTVNYAKLVGDPALTSAVSICLGWIADQCAEPLLEASYGFRNGNVRPIPNHPLAALIEDPNPYYDGDVLWRATSADRWVDGNAFWYKARGSGGRGKVRELYHLPYWQVIPRFDSEFEEISWYEYRVGGESFRLEREDVVHFRVGKDPYRRGRGISPLTPLLREIYTDTQAASYTAGLLNNMGVPSVILNPKPLKDDIPVVVDDETRQGLLSRWDEFTADGAGAPMIPSVALEVVKVGLNPAEMDLGGLMTVPVTRVCSALRLHPAIVNLGTGADPSAFDNGGQHREARRAGYQDCIQPMQKGFAKTLNRQLMPDFDPSGRVLLRWNYDEVEALQEDQESLEKRAWESYQKGTRTRNEAREMLRLCPVQQLPEEDRPKAVPLPAPTQPNPEDSSSKPADSAKKTNNAGQPLKTLSTAPPGGFIDGGVWGEGGFVDGQENEGGFMAQAEQHPRSATGQFEPKAPVDEDGQPVEDGNSSVAVGSG